MSRLFFIASLLLASVAGASSLSIESQVLGPDGRGLAGARVELRPVLRVYDQGIRELEDKGEPEPAARAVTEADGWFRLPVPFEGPWRLRLTADGFPTLDSVPRMVIGEETLDPVRMGPEAPGGWRPVLSATARAAGSRPWTLEVYDGAKPAPGALVRDRQTLAVAGRTGADGSVLLISPTPGTWALRIETRDGRIAPYDAKPVPAVSKPEARVRRRFVLPAIVPFAGRVVDRATGRAVAGARVWPDSDPAAFVVTDAAGSYRLPWTVGTPVELWAEAEGPFLTSRRFVPEDPRAVPPTLALEPAVALAGVVVDRDGRPVADAEIRVLRHSSRDEEARTRSSSRGRFRAFVPLRRESYDVLAFRPGRAPTLESVTVAGEGRTDLRLVLGPGRTGRGLVVDEEGQPVVEAEVALSRRPQESSPDEGLFRAATGADGRFEVSGLPAGWFDLKVKRPGFVPGSRTLEIGEDSGPEVDLGTVRLGRGGTVTGWVTGPDREPLADVRVWEGPGKESASGPDGHFALGGLEPGRSVLLSFCRPDRVTAAAATALEDPVEVVLEPGARLTGRVVGPDGEPIAGATVSAQAGSDPDFSPDSKPCPPASRAQGETDAAGRFALGPLGAGSFHVDASKFGYVESAPVAVELAAGADVEVPVLALRRGATVSGRILGPDGSPAPGATLGLIKRAPGGRGLNFTTADGDGRYRIENVAPGPRQVFAWHGTLGKTEMEATIEPGENRLDVTLKPEDRRFARGRVVDPDGEPVPGALVQAGRESAYTAADGSFSIPIDGNGFELTARKPGYASARLSHWSVGGAVEELELRLGREASVSGHLLGLAPEEADRAWVSARSDLAGSGVGGLIGSDGSYRIPGLSPGEWEVTARLGPRSATARIGIAPGDGEVVLDLSIPARFEVRGRVVDATGEPVERAEVSLARANGEETARTEPDGTFSIEVEEGTYEVFVLDRDYALTRGGRVTVSGGSVDGLEIRLAGGAALTGRILGIREEDLDGVIIEVKMGELGLVAEVEPGSRYRFEGLGPGDWTLSASLGADVVTRPVTVRPGEETVVADLTLPPGNLTLSGRVAGYREIASGGARLDRADGQGYGAAASLVDGAFAFPRLRPGRYLLTITDDRSQVVVRREIDLTSSQELAVDLGEEP